MPRSVHTRKFISTDLFPFLSILVCTIGTLILIIFVITSEILSNQKQVRIIAKSDNGLNQSKHPRYIECRSQGIIIYPDETFVEESNMENEFSPLGILLQEIDPAKEYFIIAIRPDGTDVFKKLRNLIEKQGIDIGYEPLDEGWRLKIKSEL